MVAMVSLSQAQTLESILASHYEVMGYEKLTKVAGITMEGVMNMETPQGPMELEMKNIKTQDGKSFSEVTIPQFGMTVKTVFDGEEGWMINPMQGEKAQPMPEEALESVKEQASIAGPLYNYEENGYKVSLEGESDVDGSPTFKLKVEKEGSENVSYYHLDQEAFVILKIEQSNFMQGQLIEAEVFPGNYKAVDGIMFPFSMETSAGGQEMEMIFDTIEINEEVDQSLFEKP